MKNIKKLASLLLAMAMVLVLVTTAFATGTTYSITVNNTKDSISINGNTYYAYKLFDVTYDEDGTSYAYTIAENFKDFVYSKTTSEGTVDYSGASLISYIAEQESDSDEMNAIAEAAVNYVTDQSITADGSATAANETATIELTEPGYYLIAGTATALDEQTITASCALTTAAPTAVVNVKADAPSIEKKIDGDTDTSTYTEGLVDYNEAAIGDNVPYVVTTHVPDMTGYEKYYFVVNDQMSKGLTFNDDVKITIGGTDLTEGTDYTVTTSAIAADSSEYAGGTAIEIVFKNFIQYKAQKGAEIVITYSGTLNTDAVIGTVGNPNEVKLTYSNNPNVQDEGTPGNSDKPGSTSPVGETPWDEVRTFVTELQIIKVDDLGNRLTGAEFELKGERLNTVLVTREVFTEDEEGTYWKLKDSTYTTDDPATEGMDQSLYEDINTKYSKSTNTEIIVKAEEVTYKGVVGDDGVLTFTGLSAGEYTITELKAPDGYNLLKDPIHVRIGWDGVDETAGTACTWYYVGTDVPSNVSSDSGEIHSPLNTITVINQSGAELPSTGGMGTTIFYILGGVLVLAAVVLLVTKKRMSAKN